MAAPTPRELVLEVLPAREGGALLLTWGPSHDRHRMLIDFGPGTGVPSGIGAGLQLPQAANAAKGRRPAEVQLPQLQEVQ